MSRLHIVDSGILYINPDPAYYHVAAFFPSVVQLSEQEFICVYQRGDGMYAANCNIARLRTLDGGVTWTDEGYLYDKSRDDRPYSYHATFTARMSDGTLVVCPFRADRSNPQQPFFSETGGLIANDPLLFTSRDGGHSWSGPHVIALPEGLVATAAQSIIELRDGRWLATFDQWPAFGDPGPYQPRMLGFFSDDHGQSWKEMVVMADGAADGKGFWHGRAVRLSDGRLFSLFWSANISDPDRGPVDLPIHYSYADPTGHLWEKPQPTTLPGQTNCTAELPDGRLAAIYTWRESERPGFMVALSDDGGRTWDLDHQLRVWDATGWTRIGLSSRDRYPRSHDTIAFGAPSVITTMSGELFASWWCTYASLTHLRWARIRP
jgi:hypothetical protein